MTGNISLIDDWQSWAAAGVVALTLLVFTLRLGKKRGRGCGGGCGCDMKKR